MNKHFALMLIALAIVAVTAGCGSLSLFSSRHVHYHGSEKTDGKVDMLEKRINELERDAKRK